MAHSFRSYRWKICSNDSCVSGDVANPCMFSDCQTKIGKITVKTPFVVKIVYVVDA